MKFSDLFTLSPTIGFPSSYFMYSRKLLISNGLGMLNVESQWQMVVNGIIIILAVGFDEIKRRKNWGENETIRK